ncbi:alpha/beta hydrolase [Nonomuraea salmonea]|uniref:alpha/beta fold hydrolase n=1 Tax=Nonomuraea salmonea TaxID=46181 RepID=UPI0031E5D16E
MPYAQVGPDVRLFYTDDGDAMSAPPLLLVHGWGTDSHQWSWHIDALAERHRVIAVDLRGHGYSSVPETGNTPRAMAADLDALLGRLGIPQVVAVGHSMGGQVVSILAVEHPERVRALVTLDPGYGMSAEIAAGFPRMIAGLRGERPHEAAEGIDEWCTNAATPRPHQALAQAPPVRHAAARAGGGVRGHVRHRGRHRGAPGQRRLPGAQAVPGAVDLGRSGARAVGERAAQGPGVGGAVLGGREPPAARGTSRGLRDRRGGLAAPLMKPPKKTAQKNRPKAASEAPSGGRL